MLRAGRPSAEHQLAPSGPVTLMFARPFREGVHWAHSGCPRVEATQGPIPRLRLCRCRCRRGTQPVMGWVGVDPFASKLSKPSGMDSIPGVVPDTSVMPYCHTIESVAGSMTTTRFR